ncbi:MAG: AAA family ATPase, partial [Peptococcaceae bacterium]|nr:AAA family ATPase [Peptococcaceae bacterium]
MMKKLPLGIQNFKEIIQGGYVYIDKTRYIYDLLSDAKCYFLSRPRRFGKSLLLDTISEAFSGDKELFKGLWIYDSDYAFIRHPVIRLDMSNIANETPDILRSELSTELKRRASREGI